MRTIALLLLATALAVPTAMAALPPAVTVAAAGFSFLPPVLVIDAGTTVTWTSVALPHTATSAADLAAAAGGVASPGFDHDIPQGASASTTFSTPGTYAYFCKLHARFGMVGEIVVK